MGCGHIVQQVTHGLWTHCTTNDPWALDILYNRWPMDHEHIVQWVTHGTGIYCTTNNPWAMSILYNPWDMKTLDHCTTHIAWNIHIVVRSIIHGDYTTLFWLYNPTLLEIHLSITHGLYNESIPHGPWIVQQYCTTLYGPWVMELCHYCISHGS